MGLPSEAVAETAEDDKRFKHQAWRDVLFFDLLKQAYLIGARNLQDAVDSIPGLDDDARDKVSFFTRQYIDALAPTNFAATNPEVWRATLDSYGQNLTAGLQNFLNDLESGGGKLNISMTDPVAFELGKNIATTAGKVVYQNDMLQLIQYSPTTKTVFAKPLLIVPPWINKFYILDLQAKNSLVKWLVDQGHTVFMVSWVNPDAGLADKNFDNYLLEGIIAALDAIEQATGEKQVNAVGYCLGGTLLACALAYLAAKKQKRIASATFLTTMIDFADPGELGVFIDEAQVSNLETRMREQGYLDGKEMSSTFNLLRANDLIWSFVINNYLLGKEPFAFDLLYWNSDSTRMPAAMHSFYLRKMYMENKLVQVNGIELNGVGIDLSKVKTPSFFLSTEDDHIAPWKSTFAGARQFTGPVQFILGESGHIAGVVNPPAKNKYGYRTNTNKKLENAETWLKTSEQHEGSWWSHWQNWLNEFAGEKIQARIPGDGKLKALEDAPGSYVKVRST